MAKRKEFTQEEIDSIINMYQEEMVGTPTIGKRFGVHKAVINRLLKENGVEMGKSGRKYRGGKSAADKRYYHKNKENISEYYKSWANDNREFLRMYHTKWRDKNRESLNNKNRIKERERRSNDPRYKLMVRTRTSVWSCLKERDINKRNSTFDLLGYSLEDLISHLENQFTEGMTWDNYGEWHLDHIIPMSKFDFTDVTDYEFHRCWSLSNLRPMWGSNKTMNGKLYEGNLNKGATLPDTCYQFRIRENKRREEEKYLPFNSDDCDLNNTTIREITKMQAKKVIEEYEWLGYVPSYTKYHFGIFFLVNGEEYLGGVLTFQKDYVENVGGWDKYDYSGKIILLSRGVCIWWTPKNTASYFISKVLKWLEQNTHYKVVTATVDSLAGEIGTIYQSTNWYYTGVMDGNILKNGKERERLGVIIDSKLYTSRQIRGMLGTMKKKIILEHYPDAKFVKQKAKQRYFYFLGSRKERKLNLSKIKSQLKPYPKR